MGAVGVAIVEQLIAGMGPSGTFLVLGLVTVAVVPLLVVQWYGVRCGGGRGWRGKQRVLAPEALRMRSAV